MTPSRRLRSIHSIEDFRAAARRSLPRMVFDYIEGGAGSESTVRENRAALDRVRLVPSAPVDVSARSRAVELFGRSAAMPLIIGPTGLASAFWPDGELALARAAARHGIPFVLGSSASPTPEEVAAVSDGRRWYQLYLPPNRELARRWVARVAELGFEVLEITVDTAVPGNRLRDTRHRFTMPFRWTPAKLIDVASHPRWALKMARHGLPRPGLVVPGAGKPRRAENQGEVRRPRFDPAVSWEDFKWLRELWRGPLVVKGLTDPRQARHAVAIGLDGIVVSNHGGRQLEGCVATIDVLPEFVAEVGGKLTLLIDGGFMAGTDILKALALGAAAVQVGRAPVFALSTAGEAGVDRALTLFAEEIDSAMALLGVTSPAELGEASVRR